MKKEAMKRLLAQELEYPELTERANQRFHTAYGMLGQHPLGTSEAYNAEPSGKGRHWKQNEPWRTAEPRRTVEPGQWHAETVTEGAAVHSTGRKVGKAFGISFASVAAALICLVGLNFANPALAESIPGLGEIFKTLNYKRAMGSNLPTYDNIIQTVGVTEQTEKCKVTVEEAYSEGRYLFFSLKMTSEDEKINSAKWLSTHFLNVETGEGENLRVEQKKEYSVKVNGEPAEMFREIIFEKKDDYFECAAVITLPKEAKNDETLQVELVIDALRGLKPDTDYRTETPPDVEMTDPIVLNFDVSADTTHNTAAQPGTTVDGVTLTDYESTPTYFNVTLTYPCLGDVRSTSGDLGWVEARTGDGTELNRNSENTDFWPPEGTKVGQQVSAVTAFDGVPEGTKQVIVTLYSTGTDSYTYYVDGGMAGPCVFAEFTVDLDTGTAVPSETYKEKGYEKFTAEEYAAIMKAGPEFHGNIFGDNRGGFSTGKPGEWEGETSCFSLGLDSDLDADLPLELRTYWDGELLHAVPLYRTETSKEKPAKEFGGYETLTENSWLQVGNTTLAGGELKPQIKRQYSVTVYFTEYQNGEDYNRLCDELRDGVHTFEYQVVNTDTGEALIDSAKETPVHFPRPDDREQ